jgi:hypothetical protein
MRSHPIIPLLLPSLLSACTPDPGDSAEPLPPLDLTAPLGADEARAGELGEDDLGAYVGGTSGEAGAGDFLLVNDRARFVVRGLHQGHWYVGEPGSLIDMDVVRPEGQADRDGLDELLTMAGFGRLFVAEQITVLDDGRRGGAAVVQATGHDAAIPYIEGVLELPGLFEPNGVAITQTFTLEPGSPALRVTTTVDNVTDDDLVLDMLDAGMTDVATFAPFTPGAGFEGEAPDGDRPMLAMISHMNDQAWAIYQADADMPDGLASMGAGFDMLLAQGDHMVLDEGDQASYTRLVAVARDQATLEAHRRSLRELPTGMVRGVVTEAGTGEPVAGARVFLTDAEGDALVLAITDTEGAYSLSYEPGEAWLVVVGDGSNEWMELPGGPGAYGPYAHPSTNERALLAYSDPGSAVVAPIADGYGRSEPVAVNLDDGGSVEQDLELPQRAWLAISTRDGDGEPVPAVVFVSYPEGGTDPRPADGRLGEDRPRGDARKATWVVDGDVLLPLPPGDYELWAHHGFEYELGFAEDVQAVAGETRAVELVLERAIDTSGWVSIDPHSHASPSLDGECTIEERLVTAVANGLDVHVATDHDHVSDYRPVATAMGLDSLLLTVPGDEISPTVRGHHNIYPVEPWTDEPNNGSPRWWEEAMTTSELHAAWKERVGEEGVLQINHGRESSGMFAAAEYDPYTGEPGEPDYYGDAFDVMEVLNSKGFGDAVPLMIDWCSLLDQGLRPGAVAVSDSHSRLSGPGLPRTWVRLEREQPSAEDLPELISALKEGRAVLSGGPLLTVSLSDGTTTVGVGETLEATSATLSIQVQAPSWVPVERVQLFTSGCVLVQEWWVDPETAVAPLWFDTELELAPEDDSYWFVLAQGSQDLGPAWSGAHPWAMSNPVYQVLP